MVGERAKATMMFIACIAALVAAPLAASGTRSGGSFSGDICSLLTATQVAIIVGDSGGGSKDKCVASPAKTTPAGTTYHATAGTATVTKGGLLELQLVKYAKPSLENLVRNGYKTMTPITGIGDWAYKRIGPSPVAGGASADLGELVFGHHGYGAVFTVRAAPGKKVNQAALETLSKAMATKL